MKCTRGLLRWDTRSMGTKYGVRLTSVASCSFFNTIYRAPYLWRGLVLDERGGPEGGRNLNYRPEIGYPEGSLST